MDITRASFYVAAMLVCAVCLLHSILMRRIDKNSNKIFVAMLVVVIVSALTDGTAYMIRPLVSHELASSVYAACNYIYFVSHPLLPGLFFFYMMEVSGWMRMESRLRNILLFTPLLFCELIAITNPLTLWMYSYNDAGEFVRSWGVYTLYVMSAFYLASGIVILLRYWSSITARRRRSLALYVGIVIAGTVIQLLIPEVKSEVFGEALSLMGLMLTVENEDDRIDVETGVYDRRMFNIDIANMIGTGRHFNIVCVHVANTDVVIRISGLGAHTDLMGSIADWLKTIAPWYRIYRATPDTFAIVSLSSTSHEAQAITKAVHERFAQPWTCLDNEFMLKATVMRAAVPENLATAEDVMFMADSPAPKTGEGDVLAGPDLDYLKRRLAVEKAVARGLEEGNFEMYYQPLCRADGSVCGAEALMRLTDPEIGNVPPYEFIEVAERTGTIDEIGIFALDEACHFLQSGEPDRIGVEKIHVNLSMVQCMQPDIVAQVRGVVEEHGVNPGRINLEITESVAADNQEVLEAMMAALIADGFSFSMDDYGTGFSNMQSMLNLEFGVVKIDKSIVWGAEKDETGRAILENTMRMMRQTRHETVAEGVETAEQIELLRRLGIDYLQGYYFSRPLPREDFVVWASTRK